MTLWLITCDMTPRRAVGWVRPHLRGRAWSTAGSPCQLPTDLDRCEDQNTDQDGMATSCPEGKESVFALGSARSTVQRRAVRPVPGWLRRFRTTRNPARPGRAVVARKCHDN